MRTLLLICLLATSATFVCAGEGHQNGPPGRASALLAPSPRAGEKTPEETANAILKDRTAHYPLSSLNDGLLFREFDVRLYDAALRSEDKKLKALVAIMAIRAATQWVKGDQPLSADVHERRLRQHPDYVKLQAWYWQLIDEDLKASLKASGSK